MLRTVVAFSLLAGIIFGGKLLRLADVRIKGLAWIIASFVVKFALVFLSGRVKPQFVITFIGALVVYGLLLYGMALNLRLPGFSVLFAGIILNFIVIILNGGRMPVDTSLLDPVTYGAQISSLNVSLIHKPLLAGDKARFLADVFAYRFFSKIPTTFSIGDILMSVGITWFILHVMLKGFPETTKDVKIIS